MLRAVDGSGLGILRTVPGKVVSHPLSTLPPDVQRKLPEPVLLNITKANSRATVQRGSHLDYVGVKRIDENGRAVGERRFLGLYPRSVAKAALHEIRAAKAEPAQGRLRRGGRPACGCTSALPS